MIAIGTVLHGTYRLEELIGQGGMGVVFRASHLRVPRPYAIKVLQPQQAERDGAFQRFRREAEICSRLGHPNLVEVYDFNRTDDGYAYFVMELLEGHDLSREIAARAPMPLGRVLEILGPVASALEAAHQAGVVHRDLKPQNLFLARKAGREQVKILDFGISKILGSVDQTRSESVVGTPLYMSPEQARGDSKHVDGRSDQFALAAIAHEMLSGRRAFKGQGESPYTILYRIVNDQPDPLVEASEPVRRVIERGLAKRAEARFPDVGQLVAALEAAGRGEMPPPAPESGPILLVERTVTADSLAPVADAHATTARLATAEAAQAPPDGTKIATPGAPKVPASDVSTPDGAPPRARAPVRRSRLLGLGVVGLVAIGGLLAAGLTSTPRKTPPGPPAPVVAPAPKAATPPATPVATAPTSVATPVAAPAASSRPTRLELMITPPAARVLLRAHDGSSRTVEGPFGRGDHRELSWPADAPPVEIRVVAEGWEPTTVPVPPPGSATGPVELHLRRRHAPTPKAPATHHELSYPWQ